MAVIVAPPLAATVLAFFNLSVTIAVLASYLVALLVRIRLFGTNRRDAVTVLSFFVALLLLIPSDLVIRGIGAIGQPSIMIGLSCLLWWAVSHLAKGQGIAKGPQPVRVALYIYLGVVLASYAAAQTRSMPGIESRAADRGLLMILGMSGIALLCADGIHNRERLDTLLQRLVFFTSIIAAIGVLQFETGYNIVSVYRHIPGLNFNLPTQFIETRSHFRRVQSTTADPIEFGMVLVMVLPVALHYAIHDVRDKLLRRWWKVILIAVAIPMSLSRSAFLGLAVVGLVLFAVWPWQRLLRALIAVGITTVLMRLAIPGLLGTIRGAFFGISTDPSIIHRHQDLQRVSPLMHHHLIIGRGFGTFVPQEFFTGGPIPSLDNQYLGAVVETGIIGLCALILMLAIFFFTARGARRRSIDPEVRHLGQALAASIVAAAIGFYTFDAFAFSMFTGVLFLLSGCAGALWRLSTQEQENLQPVIASRG